MKIFAENKITDRDFMHGQVDEEYKKHLPYYTRRYFAMTISAAMENLLPIQVTDEGKPTETRRTELFVLSNDQMKLILTLVKSLESYCTSYGQVDAIQEKLKLIINLTHQTDFEIPEELKHYLEPVGTLRFDSFTRPEEDVPAKWDMHNVLRGRDWGGQHTKLSRFRCPKCKKMFQGASQSSDGEVSYFPNCGCDAGYESYE